MQYDHRLGLIQQKLEPHLFNALEPFGSHDGFFAEGSNIRPVLLHGFQQRFQRIGKQKIICIQEEDILPGHMLHALISGTGRGAIVVVKLVQLDIFIFAAQTSDFFHILRLRVVKGDDPLNVFKSKRLLLHGIQAFSKISQIRVVKRCYD